jgi:hypothetical protein
MIEGNQLISSNGKYTAILRSQDAHFCVYVNISFTKVNQLFNKLEEFLILIIFSIFITVLKKMTKLESFISRLCCFQT